MEISQVEQATLVITAHPAAGSEAEWERRAQETTRAAAGFPGHLGTTVLRPPADSGGSYQIIVRFRTVADLERWRSSPERAHWVAQLQALEAGPRTDVTLSGLEAWFQPPAGAATAAAAPPRWKMAVIVWIAVYLTVLPLLAALRPGLAGLHPLLASAIGTTASVGLMTWVVLPLLSRLFQRWLYRPAGDRALGSAGRD